MKNHEEKSKGKPVVRLICFLLLFAVLFLCVNHVLADKLSKKNIYGIRLEPKDSIEVVFLGNSHANNAFLPMEILRIYGILSHGLDLANMALLAISIAVMIGVDILSYRGMNLIDKVFDAKLALRWVLLYLLIFAVLVFGIYGPGYDPASFIYDKF